MPSNPFAHACTVPACGAPVTVRGRCALHAGQLDAQRALGSDRQHADLYASAQWLRLRRQILDAHPWCECDVCQGGLVYFEATTVVHHRRPHGGNETLFFDRENLQALAKSCHDRLTGGRTRGGRRNK